ncbi:FAD-dependent oxidoreductase [Citreimonas salinaria]|uniref:Glycine/D-amino acid oxidase n=1 Tax=Citreimonas salinaria TaxID=321339 RepID=A0A1H3F0Y3_9RHOB|nr:FAD-dependent oxidoreductase [Citreimonas salinaria]SDX83834.1 Glycine/D-amino acid oxidase [Citreimonas salinaria]
MTVSDRTHDILIVGGGFYGCCLALFMRSLSLRVLLVESEETLMHRASRINQARIHTGFHYPRSALTAIRSMALHHRFMADFSEAVVDDFQMLYAISRQRSKVSAKRFYRMFEEMGAPIRPASAAQAALFDDTRVEGVFACTETAFDYTILRQLLSERLARGGVTVMTGTQVTALADGPERVVAGLSTGAEVTAAYAFNVTYSRINAVLDMAGLPRAPLKHELAELALVDPPEELRGYAITLMDGPFFSFTPFPAENTYCLTHVRYTPHESWKDDEPEVHLAEPQARDTQVRHMINDGKRYLPSLARATYKHSFYEVKTVLMKNERDDGRPILFQRNPAGSRVISILGGKVDNIYDLFDLVRQTSPEFAGATIAPVRGSAV